MLQDFSTESVRGHGTNLSLENAKEGSQNYLHGRKSHDIGQLCSLFQLALSV